MPIYKRALFFFPLNLVLCSALVVNLTNCPAWSASSANCASLLQRAYHQLSSGEYSPAVKTLCGAVIADRDSLTARRYLAFALVQTGNPTGAIQQLQLVTRLVRPTAFDCYAYGEAYLHAGDYRLAEDSFKDALTLKPQLDAARGGLARTLALTGRFDDAIKLCQEGYWQSVRDQRLASYYRMLYQTIKGAQARLAPDEGTDEVKPPSDLKPGQSYGDG